MRVAEQYLQAFSQIAKEGTTVLLPTAANDPAAMVTQALSIFNKLGGPGTGGTTLGNSARGSVVDVGVGKETGGLNHGGQHQVVGKGAAREGAHRETGRLASASVSGGGSPGGVKAQGGFSLQKA